MALQLLFIHIPCPKILNSPVHCLGGTVVVEVPLSDMELFRISSGKDIVLPN